jgi:soluble lytic murein transglycosylase-like protein
MPHQWRWAVVELPLRLLPTATMRRKRLQPFITEAWRSAGLLPSWGLAFAMCESEFRPWWVNKTHGDGRRGGAFGLYQMTLATARSLGFLGEPEELLDLDINAHMAIKLIKDDLMKRGFKGLRDIACGYNSNCTYARAPAKKVEMGRVIHDARGYADKVVSWQAKYASYGVDG